MMRSHPERLHLAVSRLLRALKYTRGVLKDRLPLCSLRPNPPSQQTALYKRHRLRSRVTLHHHTLL
jgi:hypothetical protein